MKQIVTTGIMLSRTNYGEADRILTVITPDQGKLKLLAKGVRKIKSKMAGGIELFTVNELTYIKGKGELGTLISSRLKTNYGNIVTNINRTMFAYEVLKIIHKITEEAADSDYFQILNESLIALNEVEVETSFIRLWLYLSLLRAGGHMPNLETDTEGRQLVAEKSYTFDFDSMSFVSGAGTFRQEHIKILRLTERTNNPGNLTKIVGGKRYVAEILPVIQNALRENTNVKFA